VACGIPKIYKNETDPGGREDVCWRLTTMGFSGSSEQETSRRIRFVRREIKPDYRQK
jgi:hypothetical protein